jgi:hypothetical protein
MPGTMRLTLYNAHLNCQPKASLVACADYGANLHLRSTRNKYSNLISIEQGPLTANTCRPVLYREHPFCLIAVIYHIRSRLFFQSSNQDAQNRMPPNTELTLFVCRQHLRYGFYIDPIIEGIYLVGCGSNYPQK